MTYHSPVARSIPDTSSKARWFSIRAIPVPSVLIFAALAGATVAVALSIRSGQRARLHLETEQTALRCAAELTREIENLTDPLDDLKDKLRGQQVASEQEFQRLAGVVRTANPSLHMTLAWVGADGRIKATSPENDLLRPPTRHISVDWHWAAAWELARGTGRPAFGEPYVNADDIKVRCAIPLFEGGAAPPAPFVGALLAWISLQEPGDRVFAPVVPHFRAEVMDGSVTLFATDQDERDTSSAYKAAAPVDIAGRRWVLKLTATTVYTALRIDFSPIWILYGGLIVSMLVSGLVRQSVRARLRHDELLRRHLLALRKLFDRARRDADAKAMLLRELNHRVKNNLTSIIALLSLEELELPAAARQWLDRAIDRIRAIARAHEMFSGGMDRVSLAELIAQTIPSLSVVKPPAVSIMTDLDGVEETLGTDRAVSLAMALHEICYNAIVHGVGDSGTVTIRARACPAAASADGDARTVVIEVIDRADTPPSGVPHANGSGLGLMLVNGLVGNELAGKFSLTRSESGGSIARIEFPVTGDKADRLEP